jgi:hypothetical protein
VESITVEPMLVLVRCRLKRLSMSSAAFGVNVRDPHFARPYRLAASHGCTQMHLCTATRVHSAVR